MHEHEAIIHRLYTSLQSLDAEGMISCYHKEATFQDPVFILKNKQEIAAMWTMLCSRAKKFELSFEQVEANDETGSAYIEASYLFSQTKRMVHNKIDSQFRFKDGLIIQQIDTFNFWKWSRQALGMPGLLLGWTPLLKRTVQKRAKSQISKL